MKTPAFKVPRCFAALAGLILVVALTVLVVALPWLRQNQFYQDAIDTRAGQLERFLSIIAGRGDVEAQQQALKANKEIATFYLNTSDPSLAGVELQRRIEESVKATGGSLVSAQILPPEDEGPVMKIGVRLRLRGFPDDLRKLLYRLEISKPLLFVPRLSVLANRGAQRPTRANANDMLNVNVDVHGYIRKNAG